uniref:Uncharacterized protein n=1 Tax=Megaselia scalaris TaxID=36166 RepID=T1GR91_MEGSC
MYINFLQYRKMTNLKFNITLILFIFISSSLDFTLADIFTDYFSDYECNKPLMEYAVLTATSSLRDRGPEKARL